MRCVQIDTGGNVVDVSPQPADVSACTLVLVSPAEIPSTIFAMSVDDALFVSWGIAAMWIAAFVIRSLVRSL